MGFADLKRNRSASMAKLLTTAQSVGGDAKKSYNDDRIWKPTVDKANNGYAVIRFLPAPEGENDPWIQYWDHGFKGPVTGRWYIERSLTSIGQDDPVSEMNTKLWNSGNDDDKSIARNRKRRLHYVSNIQVIKDDGNPANEGKVFLYVFGKKIFDKIIDSMQPQFADEDPINPFDFWDGADFKLKIRDVEGYRNYDKSEFGKPGALASDEELEGIYGKLHSLEEYNSPSNYKTYAELKTKLMAVLGEDGVAMSTAEHVTLDVSTPAPMRASQAESNHNVAPEPKAAADDEDDTLSYFNRLAAED
tara:strand:+ start:46 stop:957 length:912 start_codon:yes stop_codon:yes gene_type:complete